MQASLAWKTLPIDAFPDVTNVQVMILTDAPGLASVDVEQQVTVPVELAMQGLPGVRQVRSMSKAGFSQVIIVLEDDVDIYFARQLVFQRLQAAKKQLPDGVEPEMGPISTGLGEIYQYTLESDRRSPMELRTIQDWLIAPQLRSIPGVNEVNSFGGFVKQYHVLVDQNRLLKYGITLADVLDGLQKQQRQRGRQLPHAGLGASLRAERGPDPEHRGHREHRACTPRTARPSSCGCGRREDRAGNPAGRRDARRQGRSRGRHDHHARGSNSKMVVEAVKKAIPKIQAGLPKDVKINPFYDRTALIQACIHTVGEGAAGGRLLRRPRPVPLPGQLPRRR